MQFVCVILFLAVELSSSLLDASIRQSYDDLNEQWENDTLYFMQAKYIKLYKAVQGNYSERNIEQLEYSMAQLKSHLQFPAYEQQSASNKLKSIQAQIMASQHEGTKKYEAREITGARLIWDFTKVMNHTFGHISDTLGYTGQHKKYVHQVGYSCAAKFIVATGHPFTGLFQYGAKNILLRFSYTYAPDWRGNDPAVAVKMFRDNLPSSNFVTVKSVEGQKEANFFAHPLTNHILPPQKMGLLKSAYYQAFTKRGLMVGLSDFANSDENGKLVHEMVTPYQLFLVPTEEIAKQTTSAVGGGTRDLGAHLAAVAVNTKLYDIYAIENPGDTRFYYIGHFTTTSDILPSGFGDRKLFFKHQPMVDDFNLYRVWRQWFFKRTPFEAFDGERNLPNKCPFH